MIKSFKYIIVILLLAVVSLQTASAQCAMCRATVENNVSNGDLTVGAGLNLGILYLFIAPYILLTVLGVLWYKKAKRKKKLSL